MIKGAHPVVRAIVAAAQRIAPTDMAVFISGERGSGKELLGRVLHAGSRRAAAAFVRLDCTELSPERMDGELFAASVPAFGQVRSTANLLDRARGGTLFLDELPAMPLDVQERLPALFAGGGDVRIVASSQRDMAVDLGSERLSAHLIEYLAPLELCVPALRQRRSDIPLLIEHFLAVYGDRHGIGPCRMQTDAMVQLWQYDWPGNVRELESLVERIVVLSRGALIGPGDLPPHIAGGRTPLVHRAAPRPPPPGLRPLF
ncbi:MAG: sigma-54-dependent transcriptional regulator [Candidatus Binatia bacterium]